MVSYLPVPGSFFALANRILSPSIVQTCHIKQLMRRDLHADGCIGSRIFFYLSPLTIDMSSVFPPLSLPQLVSCHSGFQPIKSLRPPGYQPSLFSRSYLICSMLENTVKSNSGLPASRQLRASVSLFSDYSFLWVHQQQNPSLGQVASMI